MWSHSRPKKTDSFEERFVILPEYILTEGDCTRSAMTTEEEKRTKRAERVQRTRSDRRV